MTTKTVEIYRTFPCCKHCTAQPKDGKVVSGSHCEDTTCEEPCGGDVEENVELPAKYEVCSDCQGKGSTYLGWPAEEQPALTREDFEEDGPDFMEDYLEGRYDKTCPGCHGRTTVLVVDDDLCENHSDPKIKEAYKLWLEQERDEAESRAIEKAERRMGA